ncbi:MAG: ABC transporter ATP-binding protein [Nitrospirae bacterium]|nr:ABC transporter ATP-binding protein [Nitrospirota bacterium]
MLNVSFLKNIGNFALDVSFVVDSEILVLFGPSGSGKSLTLRIISGLIKPDKGFIKLNNASFFDSANGINLPINKRGVGYVLQDYALFPHMTVFENITYGSRKGSRTDINKKAAELQKFLRLEGTEGFYPHQLSGGQKQRVAIARAIASEPAVLLLDEPLAALDYPVRSKIRNDLIAIHKRFRMPTIVVTHDIEEAFVLGDRIAVIEEGRIEQIGSRDEVFYKPATRKVARLLAVKNIFDGVVKKVSSKGLSATVESDGFSITVNSKDNLKAGGNIEFCIRPEDIKIIRAEGEGLKAKGKMGDKENIISAKVFDIQEKGLAHTIFAGISDDDYLFQINLPNSTYRKLSLKKGEKMKLSLPRELVWVIS